MLFASDGSVRLYAPPLAIDTDFLDLIFGLFRNAFPSVGVFWLDEGAKAVSESDREILG